MGLFLKAFADDMVLVAESKKQMARAVGILLKRIQDLDLKLNVKKSGIMVLYRRRNKNYTEQDT